MIRIRPGQSWKHDPLLQAALKQQRGYLALAARAAVDALAVEVDGFDLAKGRAEGELLPALEQMLRAVARLFQGAAVATVPFRDGDFELVLRRRGPSALITAVDLTPPSRVLARDVEVELDALAAAALEASADFLSDLAALVPEEREPARKSPELAGLRAAARDLRKTGIAEATPRNAPDDPLRRQKGQSELGPYPAKGVAACLVTLHDDEEVLLSYEGGRPDIGSLLVPGTVKLLAPDGTALASWVGMPFLALRDLANACTGLLVALRNHAGNASLSLPRGALCPSFVFDLGRGMVEVPGRGSLPCEAIALVRGIAEAASAFAREARHRNPRQADNGYLAELESAAADHLAQVDEIERAALPASGPAPGPRTPARQAPERPLGPGRLRRLSFRRTFETEVGALAGEGLLRGKGLIVAAGETRIVAIEPSTGVARWRALGARAAWLVQGGVAVLREGMLSLYDLESGAVRFEVPLQGDPSMVLALTPGPLIAFERGDLLGLDSESGATQFRLSLPGAARAFPTAAGDRLVIGADTGFVYGLSGDGKIVFRVLGPGPVIGRPRMALGVCLVACAVGPGAALLAIDAATGHRLWEAPLDFLPTDGPVGWGRRFAVSGGIAGETMVAAISADGLASWTVSPSLTGRTTLAVGDGLLVARGQDGALLALARDGSVRWSRAAVLGTHPSPALSPAIARGTLLTASHDGLAAFHLRTGERVGAIPGVSPVRLAVDSSLTVVTLDADGLVSGFRLATHLSVIDPARQ